MSSVRKPRRVTTVHRSPRYYGWIPDIPDRRDYLYAAYRRVLPAIPDRVDLTPLCSKVENQGALGSCTANALAGVLEFLEMKDGVTFEDFSRLFIYYNERVLLGTVATDSGAMLRDGIKTLAKQGVCGEKRWPYVIKRFTRKPTSSCYADALNHQITSYHRILTLDEMLGCLAEGFPFVFGFAVYESFESQEVERTGVVNLPAEEERMIGGHAVVAVGFSLPDKRFLVRNSWGENWGKKGYFTMPFDYLANRNLSDDFWSIRRGEDI
jgi:C1A family cysteine protease